MFCEFKTLTWLLLLLLLLVVDGFPFIYLFGLRLQWESILNSTYCLLSKINLVTKILPEKEKRIYKQAWTSRMLFKYFENNYCFLSWYQQIYCKKSSYVKCWMFQHTQWSFIQQCYKLDFRFSLVPRIIVWQNNPIDFICNPKIMLISNRKWNVECKRMKMKRGKIAQKQK